MQGSILATVTVYASNRHLADQGIISWRLSLWIQIICPAFVCLGVWFCPESPRWYVHGQDDWPNPELTEQAHRQRPN